MTIEDTNLQEEFDEMNEEYEEILSDVQAEISDISAISTTQMHAFNIVLATIMIIIGAILAYQTRNAKLKNGKKIAGWILLILGGLALITHTIQLIF